MRRSRILVPVLALFASMAPASAVEYAPSPVWFHAVTTPVGTIDHQLGTDITWSDVAPTGTGALTLGNNYSTFTDLADVPGGERYDQTFVAKGSIDGDFDTLAVDLYFFGPAGSLCGMGLAWQVIVDGVEILHTEQSAPSANLEVTPETVASCPDPLTIGPTCGYLRICPSREGGTSCVAPVSYSQEWLSLSQPLTLQ